MQNSGLSSYAPAFLFITTTRTIPLMLIQLAVIGILAALFVSQNPFLFGIKVDTSGFDVVTNVPSIDDQLQLPGIRQALGEDYDRYRNHCLRVYTFSKFFLPEFVVEEMPNALNVLGVALAYHDIALWTDGELDYLDPSAKEMYKHVSQQENLLTKEEMDIASVIIEEHHKLTSYTKGTNETVNALVNAARKADWADFTLGIVGWALPSGLLQAAYDAIPELGFHRMLAGMGARLSPDSLVGRLAVLKIFKW